MMLDAAIEKIRTAMLIEQDRHDTVLRVEEARHESILSIENDLHAKQVSEYEMLITELQKRSSGNHG